MGYRRAEEILPNEIIELIQQYVDGTSIYIPRKTSHRQGWGTGTQIRQGWGTGTQIRQELSRRDRQIYEEYLAGSRVGELACKYYLSEKSIQRILRVQKYS